MKSWKTRNGYNVMCVLPGRSNVFLITYSGKNVLVDTSTGRNASRLRRALRNHGTDNIDYLILTHTHHDHAGNAKMIREDFGARVIVNELEKDFLLLGKTKIPAGTNFFTRFLTNSLVPTFNIVLSYTPCQFDILISDTFSLSGSGLNIEVIHTPGHSSGSQSVIIDNEIVLTGDTIFGIILRSIFPPFADDVPVLIKSWKRLIETGCKVFLPSHGSMRSLEDVGNMYKKYKSKVVQQE